MALTWRVGALTAVGAVIVGVWLPNWIGVLTVLGLLAAGVLADLLLAAPVAPLALSRDGDSKVRLGDTARVGLLIANPSGRRLRALVRDAWAPSAGLATPPAPTGHDGSLAARAWAVLAGPPKSTTLRRRQALTVADPTLAHPRHRVDVPSGERRRIESVLRPYRRGDHHAGQVTVRSFGPLGLAARQRSLVVPWRLRALPPFASRRHLPSRLARLREMDGRTSLLVRGQGTEFDSLRDYTAGDDLRSIDWRATARRHVGDHYDVVVRTWRPERDRHILIVVDTGRTAAGRIGRAAALDGSDPLLPGADGTRLDAALDAALLLTALGVRAGDRVDLLAYDREVQASVVRAAPTQTLQKFTETMSVLAPDLVELDARALVRTILTRTRQRALVVLLTSLDAAPMTEGLLPVIGLLTKRHEVIVASVADPRIEEMAAGRADVTAVYEAASAERAKADRRQVADLLTKRRVTVVDAPPEGIAPALADAYLALKAAGRL